VWREVAFFQKDLSGEVAFKHRSKRNKRITLQRSGALQTKGNLQGKSEFGPIK
jgi:hypothetical protein